MIKLQFLRGHWGFVWRDETTIRRCPVIEFWSVFTLHGIDRSWNFVQAKKKKPNISNKSIKQKRVCVWCFLLSTSASCRFRFFVHSLSSRLVQTNSFSVNVWWCWCVPTIFSTGEMFSNQKNFIFAAKINTNLQKFQFN